MENVKAICKVKFCFKNSDHSRIVSMASSFMLMSQLDVNDINMDKSGFGLEKGLPYCNTKFCLALLTRELSRRRFKVHSYALCPGMVNTAITSSSDVAPGIKLFYRITMSTLSLSADEVNFYWDYEL